MPKTCKGICLRHKAESVQNSLRYEIGQKRCTFCGIFLSIIDVRCICCNGILRTKPRNKMEKKKNQNSIFYLR